MFRLNSGVILPRTEDRAEIIAILDAMHATEINITLWAELEGLLTSKNEVALELEVVSVKKVNITQTNYSDFWCVEIHAKVNDRQEKVGFWVMKSATSSGRIFFSLDGKKEVSAPAIFIRLQDLIPITSGA